MRIQNTLLTSHDECLLIQRFFSACGFKLLQILVFVVQQRSILLIETLSSNTKLARRRQVVCVSIQGSDESAVLSAYRLNFLPALLSCSRLQNTGSLVHRGKENTCQTAEIYVQSYSLFAPKRVTLFITHLSVF